VNLSQGRERIVLWSVSTIKLTTPDRVPLGAQIQKEPLCVVLFVFTSIF